MTALEPIVGDRVALVSTTDGHTNLQPGDRGTVTHVDSLGTVHVRWDHGGSLGLIPDEDEWKIVDRPERVTTDAEIALAQGLRDPMSGELR